jgi:hypothetical protein
MLTGGLNRFQGWRWWGSVTQGSPFGAANRWAVAMELRWRSQFETYSHHEFPQAIEDIVTSECPVQFFPIRHILVQEIKKKPKGRFFVFAGPQP